MPTYNHAEELILMKDVCRNIYNQMSLSIYGVEKKEGGKFYLHLFNNCLIMFEIVSLKFRFSVLEHT